MTMMLRILLISVVGVVLSGCATSPEGVCNDHHCTRPVSSDKSTVIWWGKSMRYDLGDDKTWTQTPHIDEN